MTRQSPTTPRGPDTATAPLLSGHSNPLLEGASEPAADLTDIQSPTVHRAALRDKTRQLRDLRRGETAEQAIAGFDKGVELFGFTKGQFSLINLIDRLLERTGPAALAISTWTAAKTDAGEVLELLRAGKITDCRWLVDLSFQRRAPAIAAEIRQIFGPGAIRVAKNHAKFAMLTNDDWRVVIRTSMNLNHNPRFEDFTVAHDPGLADFLETILGEVWAKQKPQLAFEQVKTISRHFARDL